ncbi:hypothetical protein CAPTEDRAFT_187231 [Capitella teleta]|uniref:Uncharacterized protein n=1 Tax=Capitella teleta TaxID=283909 RepID=X1ZK24_CAPTE|nr:hypothetical protein CAPTEDRAFT_187231 [Capitella teleta]|eukprot:ELU10072.1 hypothetical protein CAPTEDRAFT_187231 [Capitella teleta]
MGDYMIKRSLGLVLCCLAVTVANMPDAQEALNRSLTNVQHVSSYYGSENYHKWLQKQYPLLNLSDTSSFEYHLLTIATLERNVSDTLSIMFNNALRDLCLDLNHQRTVPSGDSCSSSCSNNGHLIAIGHLSMSTSVVKHEAQSDTGTK